MKKRKKCCYGKRFALVLILLAQTLATCGSDVPDVSTASADSGDQTESEVTTESSTAHIPDNDFGVNVKGVRDEESIEMLKLIFSNRVYDVGDILFSEASYKFLTIQTTGLRDIASFRVANESSVQAKLDTLLELPELD